MEAIFQLLIWSNAERLRDICESTPRMLAQVLEAEGFDKLAIEAETAFVDLLIVAADGTELGKWRILPGAVPLRCRKPRACIRHDNKLYSVRAFGEGVLDGSIVLVPQ